MASFSSSQEAELLVRFYDKYYKVAEEYDKVFMRTHQEDLNATFIFVSTSPNDSTRVRLTILLGWFILCCNIGFYRRLQPPTATRSE
jgi:hypothetical protein